MQTTDLIGKKFGKLTVLKFDKIIHKRDKNGKNRDKGYWICRCDCGKETSIARSDLVGGKTKSCGCLIKENGKKTSKRLLIDLTGKRFGNLVVIGLDHKEQHLYGSERKRIFYYWKCKCDCGQEISVEGNHLKEGRIKDCEDLKRNANKSYTQIGNEFKKANILKEGTRLDYLVGISKANTSGIRGVDYSKEKNKYRARIRFKGKEYHLGYFDTIEKAENARKVAEEKFYKPILEKYNYKSKKKQVEEEFE